MWSTEAQAVRGISAIYRGLRSSRKRKERPLFIASNSPRYCFPNYRGDNRICQYSASNSKLGAYVSAVMRSTEDFSESER
jgi:hypothetical protein